MKFTATLYSGAVVATQYELGTSASRNSDGGARGTLHVDRAE